MISATFAPLIAHLWQSTLVVALAGLLAFALRRNEARVRYWLWLIASFKFLIPFSLLVGIGHQFHGRTAAMTVAPVVVRFADSVGGPLFLTPTSSPLPAPSRISLLPFVVGIVWASGFLIVVSAWVRRWMQIHAIVRSAKPVPLNLPIRVLSTTARIEPGVFGLFRPVLLVPEGIEDRFTQRELQAIFAHELCHVRRRDNLAAAVHMLVEAIFWFYPLVWWLEVRMIDERERACDEAVLKNNGEARMYAESIIKVCKLYLGSPLPCVSGVTASDLKKRIERIMKDRFGETLSSGKKWLLAFSGIAALSVPIISGVLTTPRFLLAQSTIQAPTPQWQIDAGGKIEFAVASVKRNTAPVSPTTRTANIPLGPQDAFAQTGGLLSLTNRTLREYVVFAYKLGAALDQSLPEQEPQWALDYRYDIQARSASSNPTKDQFRLMMQALLEDRFKLAVHREIKQLPVFALVLDKPGKFGPKIQPHPSDAPCSVAIAPGGPSFNVPGQQPTIAGGFPERCGAVVLWPIDNPPGRFRLGARNVPLAMFTARMFDQLTGIDRPVLDKTGLAGTYDFIVEFTPQFEEPLPPGANFTPDPSGPTFQQALKEQLGFKLEAQTGPTEAFVLDHVEQPSEN